VGGECSHCGELFASSAHYCSNCGNPLTESARRELAKAQAPAAEPEAIVPVVTPPGAAEPQPATADQPTQEIGPLDPNHPSAGPEFQWPSRGIDLRKRSEGEAAAPAEGGDVASGAPVGETGADVAPAPGESRGAETPAAAAPGEDATDEAGGAETPAAASGESATGEVRGGEPHAAAAPGESATGEVRGGETPAAAETGADAAGEAQAPATDLPGDDARPPSTATDESADGQTDGGPATQAAGEPTPPAPDDPHSARNGTSPDDSILRPVERRQ
jgi:hypothetical protein